MNNDSAQNAIVVGGGIAGILSAILLKQKGYQVTLVEQSTRIGGLLNSIRNGQGFEFDCGTHFLRDTGIEELDDLLFRSLPSEQWLVLDYLKAGNYFHGSLNECSPFANTNLLPQDRYQEGMMQLLSLGSQSRPYENLDDYLSNTFGRVFTDEIFFPFLAKIMDHDLKDLIPDAHRLFIPARLIGFSPEVSRDLKESPFIDSKLAFHSYREGLTEAKNYYPSRQGIGLWIEELAARLQSEGVRVVTDSSVAEIHYQKGRIHTIGTENSEEMACDLLVWTVPTFLCLKAAKISTPKIAPPQRLITTLYHFVVDQPFLTDLFFFTCYDREFRTFRVTLYPNAQASQSWNAYHLTVEVLSKNTLDTETTKLKILDELRCMNVISSRAQVLYQQHEVLRAGFPIQTHRFAKDSNLQLDIAKKTFTNALFLGKSSGKAWFMNEVLVETYQKIAAIKN